MQPRHTLNMELRSANQNHLSKSNDNSRKALPRKSIKPPVQTISKKGIDEKRLKLGEPAQSSNTVANDAKVDPGSSNEKQSSIIIQDNQPMECAQAEETAAASNGDKNTELRSQTQRTEQKEQALSSPVKDIEEPTEIINIDNDDHSQGVKKPDQINNMNQSHFSSKTTAVTMTAAKPSTPAEQTTQPNQHNNQEHFPDSGSSLTNFRPPIDNVQDDHKLRVNEVSCYEPSNHTLNSLKMSARLYSQIDGARRLVPIREPVEIEWPISRNLATAAQNPSNLSDQTRSLLTRSVEQPPVVTQNQSQNDPQLLKMHTDNQYLPTNQGNFKLEILRGPIEGNSYDHRPTSRTIKMSIPLNRKKLTHVSNPMYQTSELPQQRESQPNQQDSQRQPQRPKIRIDITIKRKDKRQMHTLQGVTKKTQREALSTTHNNLILSQQQLQPRLSEQSTEDNNIALTTSPQSNNSVQRETQPATQSSEERHTEVTASASSSNENQQSNDVSNKPPEIQHQNLWRFVLPPEYDPHNTRWTLKYQTNLPGLVELMPQSRIYVSYGDLKYCQYVSKNCKSLARRLLSKVFNRTALSVCLTMSEKAQAPDNVGSNIRPELDVQASSVLLNFVIEQGLQRGWNTDLKPILSTLHKKNQRIRFKYGVMVKC